MSDEDDAFYRDRWWTDHPEGKLELLQGQLIISTLAGSRWIMGELLRDYGPDFVLAHADPTLWWQALQSAYAPNPPPGDLAGWHDWADNLRYEARAAPAGPRGTASHHRLCDLLSSGLWHWAETTGLGFAMGRDFVIRLGNDGPTPDAVIIDRPGLDRLRSRYLDGPPSIAVEIVTPASAHQDRILKRQLYERAGVPEYWLIDPELPRLTFYCLQPDGRYEPRVFHAQDLQRIVEEEDVVYESTAVPGLALSLRQLWTMPRHEWKEGWPPFLPVDVRAHDPGKRSHGSGGIQWDEIPFAPRVDLGPVPIRFEEYAAWCGRAKFERYGGGIKIDGTEGSRRVAGMLLMTLGLLDVVRLAHPREWITFLDRERYLPQVRHEASRFTSTAEYRRHDERSEEVYYSGRMAELPDLWAYGESAEACEQDMRWAVEGWILLRIARREPILPAK